MKLLALLIGLLVERLATQLFHLRRLPWMDRAIDFGFRQASKVASWPYRWSHPYSLCASDLATSGSMFRISFSPSSCCFSPWGQRISGRILTNTAKRSKRMTLSASLLPRSPSPRRTFPTMFAVVFWFVLLGPVGAWAYRVTDLIRRRAVFNAQREEMDGATTIVEASETLHGWLAWVPARLSAIGYAMAGSFDGALSAWRKPAEESSDSSHVQSERLLARVGTGALALPDVGKETIAERAVRGATTANGLVMRALFIWAAVIAAMTLYGWSV